MPQLRDDLLLDKIAAKIKKLREQQHVTLEQFYLDTNVNISRIESSKANISVSTLNAICKYFGITLQEFFKGL